MISGDVEKLISCKCPVTHLYYFIPLSISQYFSLATKLSEQWTYKTQGKGHEKVIQRDGILKNKRITQKMELAQGKIIIMGKKTPQNT